LEAYCGRLPHAGDWLPLDVRRWFLHQQAQWARSDTLPPPLTPLVIERENTQLHIRLLRNADERQYTLSLEERTTRLTPDSLTRLGLSPREAEVLYWLVQGKTNPEIGIILTLSARTVQTHVLRVYQKLGVETRAAAIMQVVETLGLMSR
jgi:DNA-binding CsgD family transcriptional regulator